jgi:hypothetical protein
LFTLESSIDEAVFVTAVEVYRCHVNTKLGKQQQSEPFAVILTLFDATRLGFMYKSLNKQH